MTDPCDVVTGLIALNGGQIVGKTRLQKTMFLLEQNGVETDFDFDYYRYGPYSASLAEAIDDACATKRIGLEQRLGNYQVPYSIFTTGESKPAQIGGLKAEKIERMLSLLAEYSALELEVAATISYLHKVHNGEAEDAAVIAEVKALKPLKATDERVSNAEDLLRRLKEVQSEK